MKITSIPGVTTLCACIQKNSFPGQRKIKGAHTLLLTDTGSALRMCVHQFILGPKGKMLEMVRLSVFSSLQKGYA